jgi:predicted amidophosphoribosyltransferase
MREALASLVFPAPCRLCEAELDTGSRIPFCHACFEALARPLPEPLCTRCGRPVDPAAVGGGLLPYECRLCRSGVYGFDLARSFGIYTLQLSRAIILLKYENLAPLGPWFARLLAGIVKRQPQDFAADILVPVPLDQGRLREPRL